MKSIHSVIFMNIVGFDSIIFVVAFITLITIVLVINSANKLKEKMHMTIYVPDEEIEKVIIEKNIAKMRESDIVSMRKKSSKLYSVFINLTGIFPLLGILGTVTSLLNLVSDSHDVTGNFYGALTSTFWGLVFAILFKFLDGFISPMIEENEKNVALYLERNTSQNEKTTV